MTIKVTIEVGEGGGNQRAFVQYYERLVQSWTPGKRGPIDLPPGEKVEFWIHSGQMIHVFEGDEHGCEPQ